MNLNTISLPDVMTFTVVLSDSPGVYCRWSDWGCPRATSPISADDPGTQFIFFFAWKETCFRFRKRHDNGCRYLRQWNLFAATLLIWSHTMLVGGRPTAEVQVHDPCCLSLWRRACMTRPCFTTQQYQTCKTKTTACKTRTKTDFLVSDQSFVLRLKVSDHTID